MAERYNAKMIGFVVAGLLVALGIWWSSYNVMNGMQTFSSTPLTSASIEDFVGDQEGFYNHLLALIRPHITDSEQRTKRNALDYRPIYVAVRRDGVMLAGQWFDELQWEDGLENAVAALWKYIHGDATALEVAVAHSRQPIDRHHNIDALDNIHRGIHGIELRYGDFFQRIGPGEIIAKNLSYQGVIKRFLDQPELRRQNAQQSDLDIRVFTDDHVVVQFQNPIVAKPLYRGGGYPNKNTMTTTDIDTIVDGTAAWIVKHIQDDGTVPYQYLPSSQTYSSTLNLGEQLWVGLWLLREAEHSNSDEARTRFDKYWNYIVDNYYKRDGHLGFLEANRQAQLSATALLALILWHHPDRDAHDDMFRALLATVDQVWMPNGYFHAWYRPARRVDNQHYDPGVALLLWSYLIVEGQRERYLDRFMTSISFYRRWFRSNHDPMLAALITQASYRVWRVTGSDELVQFIYDMNDWLISVQDNEDARYDDFVGRIADADVKHAGIPRSGITALSVQGLVDAWLLARELGDEERALRYRHSALLGMRNIRQLQYTDDLDMYYMAQPRVVYGGVRNRAYDNRVRVDNAIQSNIAAQKVRNFLGVEEFQ